MATPIEEFVRRYVREQDFYARVAELCGRQAERMLKDNSVRAITTWRAKRPERLQRKLEERNRRRLENKLAPYQSEGEIYEDIPDLAGVRIALYFPGDRSRVASLIRERFTLLKERVFPQPLTDLTPEAKLIRERKRFAGYGAAHYRVCLRDTGLGADEKRYTEGRCEIQVASVLMHAWSEVEHDLEYKDLSGEVSPTESALLDQINGLVIAGEIALEQLQLATYQRSAAPSSTDGGGGKRIRDQYDLANWLSSVRDTLPDAVREGVDIGRADIAFRLLQRMDETDFSALESYRAYIVQDTLEGTMAQRLIDAILAKDPQKGGALERAKLDVEAANADTIASSGSQFGALALGHFLTRWRQLEELLGYVLKGDPSYRAGYPLIKSLSKMVKKSSETIDMATRLRTLRNASVHGIEHPPSARELYDGVISLDQLVHQLPRDARDETYKSLLKEGIAKFYDRPGSIPSSDKGIDVTVESLVPLAQLRAALTFCTIVSNAKGSDRLIEVRLRVGHKLLMISEPDPSLPINDIDYLRPNEMQELFPGRKISTILYFSGVIYSELIESANMLILEITLERAGKIETRLSLSNEMLD